MKSLFSAFTKKEVPFREAPSYSHRRRGPEHTLTAPRVLLRSNSDNNLNVNNLHEWSSAAAASLHRSLSPQLLQQMQNNPNGTVKTIGTYSQVPRSRSPSLNRLGEDAKRQQHRHIRTAVIYTLTERTKWRLIKKELDELKTKSLSSKDWKRYREDLRLYTARIDDYTGTCKQRIFDCYCEEFKVVLEEISMSGDEALAKTMTNTLKNMQTYRPSESDTTDSCKKCEEFEEKSFQEFLDSFESIAQKMNVEF